MKNTSNQNVPDRKAAKQSSAIANQPLQKKGGTVALSPPSTAGPVVQMDQAEAARKYVERRKAEKRAARMEQIDTIRVKDGTKDEATSGEDEGGEGPGLLEVAEAAGNLNEKLHPTALTSKNMEWEGNRKRTETEQNEWCNEHGYTPEDVAKMKQKEATQSAVTDSLGMAYSFFSIPGIYKKFKSPDSLDKLEAGLDTAGVAAGMVKTGASISNAVASGDNETAESTADIAGYTGGIIDLVKKGYTHFKSFKEQYENYQLIKETGGEPSKMAGAKVVLDASLDLAKGTLEAIKAYQSTFAAFQSPAITASIPGLGIAISAVSLFERIYSLYTSGKLQVGSKATEKQNDSILAQLPDGENKNKVAGLLSTDPFRAYISEIASAYQQRRDNPDIFNQFMLSENDAELEARLKKRYPDNFAKIKRVATLAKFRSGDLVSAKFDVQIPNAIMDVIVEDQSIILHLEEVKGKRETNAKIGIFTDLVNIGADIATLSGAGAAVGAGLKLGTAAIAASRAGGNAVKFAARDRGAADFAGGAAKSRGQFGSAAYDNTDILKNRKAKKERYFNTAKLILDDVVKYEENRANAANAEEKKQVESTKEWIDTKILATGASLTLFKAKLNSDKADVEVIKYVMDCLKKR